MTRSRHHSTFSENRRPIGSRISGRTDHRWQDHVPRQTLKARPLANNTSLQERRKSQALSSPSDEPKPLKPEVDQKPADHGLFSDESKQIDFIDALVASPQLESTAASVPFMITQQQKERLRGLGYPEQRIWKMKPAEAHAILKEGIKVSCSDRE